MTRLADRLAAAGCAAHVADSSNPSAYVRNNRMDVLAANRLGRALASWSAQAPPANPHEPETLEETK